MLSECLLCLFGDFCKHIGLFLVCASLCNRGCLLGPVVLGRDSTVVHRVQTRDQDPQAHPRANEGSAPITGEVGLLCHLCAGMHEQTQSQALNMGVVGRGFFI